MAFALLVRVVGAQDEGGKIVSHGPQGYSVVAAQTSVVQVLTEVGEHAGFTVDAPETFNSPITLTVQNAPLDQLLRRVLRNENYIIVYRRGVQKTTISGEGIDKIFLLSPPSSQGPNLVTAAGGSPIAGSQVRNAPPSPPGAGGDVDLVIRAAHVRAQAVKRAAAKTVPALGPGGVTAAPGAARGVPNTEDIAPQASIGGGGAPATDPRPAGEEEAIEPRD